MSVDPSMRASDADREQVAERLREAHAEGRLDVEEFQQRLDTTFAARTYGDLAPVLCDLPAPAEAGPAPPVPPPAGASAGATVDRHGRSMKTAWAVWARVVSINVVIWLLVAVAARRDVPFWPIWVAGPWGAVLLVRTVSGRGAGHGRELSGPSERRAVRDDRRRQLRAARDRRRR